MKLEPGRTSLSGRPEFLRAALPVQTSAPAVLAPRKCCACGTADVVQLIEGEPDHSVAIELRFIAAQNEEQAKKQITPYLKTRGWRYRFHLARHAMERDICRPCLIAHEEIEREFKRKRSSEINSSGNAESYYAVLCGDNF